jgi:hypothetical protein
MEKQTAKKENAMVMSEAINPLRNEEIYVRFVPQQTGFGITEINF